MDLHTHAVSSRTQPQPGAAADEVTYVCMCTGIIVTIPAGDEPNFVLGQLIMAGAAVLITALIWLIVG